MQIVVAVPLHPDSACYRIQIGDLVGGERDGGRLRFP